MPAITKKPAAPVTATAPAGSAAELPLYRRLWRYFKRGVVICIVVFHLLVLAVRNPLDLWYKPIRGWMQKHPTDAEQGRTYWDRFGEKDRSPIRVADRFTYKYTNLAGIEQRWVMFSPPVARSAPFLAVRLEFTDDSSETLLSPNEPDPTSYFRVGGWQVRKLEDYLAWPPDDLKDDAELPLWQAFVRYKVQQWSDSGDPRQVQRVVLVRRRIYFPERGQTYDDVEPPSEKDVVSFTPEGKLLP
jgi:hypothetical protein